MTCLDSWKTLKLDPASTSTNRIDLIIARIYDDNNPAIGSPSGERKFTVEVWKGDASTGTPTRPIPTPAAGWIPLAEVKISAGVGAIAAADITDLRGPGLVARGGMRSLYGADADPSSAAFKEAGAYPGDQRWVHANGFQHQVFYGKSSDPLRGGWRGVHNCIVVNANPAPGELLWTKSTASPTEICRVKIPYPGTPFMVYATGRAVLTLSPDVKVDLRITIDSPTGTPVNWNTVSSLGIENPPMSASSTPTLNPRAAMPTARFAVTVLLPTPPLPDAMAATRALGDRSIVSVERSWALKRARSISDRFCSAVISPNFTLTFLTPTKPPTRLYDQPYLPRRLP